MTPTARCALPARTRPRGAACRLPGGTQVPTAPVPSGKDATSSEPPTTSWWMRLWDHFFLGKDEPGGGGRLGS